MSAGTWILVIWMHVNSGGVITFSEFNNRSACEVAQRALYFEQKRVKADGLQTAFCTPKWVSP